jgi:hypothetical protein
MLRTPNHIIEALRSREDALQLSDATADAIAGLTLGHTGKALGPSRMKSLGLMVQLVPDPDTQVQRRWKPRSAGQAHGRGRLSQLRRARADVLADLARKGGLSWWASMSPEQWQAHIAKLNAARAAKRQAGLNKAA